MDDRSRKKRASDVGADVSLDCCRDVCDRLAQSYPSPRCRSAMERHGVSIWQQLNIFGIHLFKLTMCMHLCVNVYVCVCVYKYVGKPIPTFCSLILGAFSLD